MNSSFLQVLVRMFKIGLIGFGGGTALIPIIYQETVEDSKLKLSKVEYDKYVLLASVTPGALPVEISALIGHRFRGFLGAILAAVMMALPGAFLTLLALMFISSNFNEYRQFFSMVQVGISIYIMVMLSDYLKKIFTGISSTQIKVIYGILIFFIFLLTSEKRILSLIGLSKSWAFSISLVDIVGGIFVFLSVRSHNNSRKNLMTASLCVILYLMTFFLCSFCPSVLKGIRVFLLLFSAAITIAKLKANLKDLILSKMENRFIHEIFINTLGCVLLLVMGLLPLIRSFDFAFDFMLSSLFASVISFGGGDAFLSVADAVFVDTAKLSSETFYGLIVPIVNMLPGSILCKTLTAIGYSLIPDCTLITAILFASLGFICSIVGSSSVVLLSKAIYERFENLKTFTVINRSVSVIICGLILTVIFSFIVHDLKALEQITCTKDGLVSISEIIALFVVVGFLHNYLKIKGILLIISSLLLTGCLVSITC